MECLWITTALESDINNWGLGLSRTDKVLTAHVCFHKPAQSQSRRCLTFLNITNLVVFALFYTKSTLKNSDKYSLTFSIPIDSKMFFCFIFKFIFFGGGGYLYKWSFNWRLEPSDHDIRLPYKRNNQPLMTFIFFFYRNLYVPINIMYITGMTLTSILFQTKAL